MTVINESTEHSTISVGISTPDLKTNMALIENDWALNSIYYPYLTNDVVYYKNGTFKGTFLSNIEFNLIAPDDNDDYLQSYPNSWTLISLGQDVVSEVRIIEPSRGCGNFSVESIVYPYSIGDIVLYEDGGVSGSFKSKTDSNDTTPLKSEDQTINDNWELVAYDA
jgi:hypothetical protein